MESPEKKALSTEPYKGVRDFYPQDMFIQNYIFEVMRDVVESYGYAEYSASILEPAELYKAKTGEEIVNEQTYSFIDRGERQVTLRPEMTPTVARMVARSRRELSLPIRWYSIPNLFRYEAPQRGRLREHWQLNVDIFGVKNTSAEIEIIGIAHAIMKKFRATDDQFVIILNNRRIVEAIYNYFELSESECYSISKIVDKKEKTTREEFERGVREILGDETQEFLKILGSATLEELAKNVPQELTDNAGLREMKELLEGLEAMGIKNIRFSATLMRGFDYYTGTVFEVFDTGGKNRRSLFGGGRYDDLLDIFGSEKVTAMGFGMGDVTMRDFLETYNLLPQYQSTTDVYICHTPGIKESDLMKIAEGLRERGVRAAIDFTEKKVGDQIKSADKQAIPFIICVGQDEMTSGKFKVKELATGTETESTLKEIPAIIRKNK